MKFLGNEITEWSEDQINFIYTRRYTGMYELYHSYAVIIIKDIREEAWNVGILDSEAHQAFKSLYGSYINGSILNIKNLVDNFMIKFDKLKIFM